MESMPQPDGGTADTMGVAMYFGSAALAPRWCHLRDRRSSSRVQRCASDRAEQAESCSDRKGGSNPGDECVSGCIASGGCKRRDLHGQAERTTELANHAECARGLPYLL